MSFRHLNLRCHSDSEAYHGHDNLHTIQRDQQRYNDGHEKLTLQGMRCRCHNYLSAELTLSSCIGTYPRALRCESDMQITRSGRLIYLKATETVSAFCALSPNTLWKNRLATVTPDSVISCLVAALCSSDASFSLFQFQI